MNHIQEEGGGRSCPPSAEMPYEYWLASLFMIQSKKRIEAKARLGGAKRFFYADEKELGTLGIFSKKEIALLSESRRTFAPEAAWEDFLKKSMRFLPFESAAYPERLRSLYDAPYALFAYGSPPSDRRKSVGVVGARGCSEYGRSVAARLGEVCAQYGVQVVSGLAVGIDSASHAGALRGEGDTYAVLGCGCDICYPRTSRNLYDNIRAGHGGILSEYFPGTKPQPYHFPMRNRIISAFSDVLVVVEARERSGSLITADCALEQGKDVFAVPGRLDDPLSIGCNRLLEQGAGILTDPDSFLKNAGICPEVTNNKSKLNQMCLEKEELIVYSVLCLSPKGMDEILSETGLELSNLLSALDGLKRKQLIRESFQNYFCKTL